MKYAQLLKQLQQDIITAESQPSVDFSAHHRLSAPQQLAIYAEGYQARLEKVVMNSYPATAFYAEEVLFQQLVTDFVRSTPSRHYNIDRYALGFALYSQDFLPTELAELATLEAANAEIFLLPDSTTLTPHTLSAMDESAFATIPLPLRDATRLVKFTYAVNGALSHFREYEKAGETPQSLPLKEHYIKKGATFIHLYRHQNQVQRQAVDEASYYLLTTLNQGLSLSEAIDILAQEQPNLTLTPDWLGSHFQHWLAHGVFKDVVSD